MAEAAEIKYIPRGMNLELTTCCPLHCPQCYCTLDGGKHLDKDVAIKRLREAGEMGVHTVNLSGGETLCYPYLNEVVAAAAKYCGHANVALSGWHFTKEVLDDLIASNVDGVFISLNGSTPEINALTRDGFEMAIDALKLLREQGFKNTIVNWVMHSLNAVDFPNVVRIAEEMQVRMLVVLSFKPDAAHELKSFPTAAQIRQVSDFIRSYKGTVKLVPEPCFSQLRALVFDTAFLGNLNTGGTRGCRAGLANYSINVDGDFSPCRHLDYFEKWPDTKAYWENSDVLKKLRNAEDDTREPCKECKYALYCRHCLAVSSKLSGEIFFGHPACTLYKD